jgi:UPF0716 protein FxsA
MPLLVLIAVFILVPLAELYVILKVGDLIGVGWTILLLVADSVLGSLLLRSQGRSVWRRFNTALADGRMPHREVVDGVLVIFGGAFLITPGFITDVVGLLLLIPPTRALIRALVVRRLGRRVAVGVVGDAGRRRPSGAGGDFDVEGTATESDAPTKGLEARSSRPGRVRRDHNP